MFRVWWRKRSRARLVHRATQLTFWGDETDALDLVESLVLRHPKDPEFRVLLASLLLERRPDEASFQAAKAAEIGNDDPAIQVRAGHQLLFEGRLEDARACAERARGLVSPDFVLMSGLEGLEGTLASLDGESDRAEALFRSATDRDPEYSTYAIDLARFLKNHGRTTEALAVIDESLIRANDNGKDALRRMRRRIVDEH
jgi:Flp pilus assembly protein TadD